MRFRIDLHIHSKFSGDNDSEPEDFILQAIDFGLDGIAFTEHYSYRASDPIEQLRERYADRIMIVRGVELSTAEGHCLVFGVDTDHLRLRNAPCREVIRIVNQAGGAVIPSHPFRAGHGLGEGILHMTGICAVEGYNGCNSSFYNAKAVEAARTLNVPYTGGSDAHYPEEVGSCFTEFDEMVTQQNFLDVLRKGNFRGIDSRTIARMHDNSG